MVILRYTKQIRRNGSNFDVIKRRIFKCALHRQSDFMDVTGVDVVVGQLPCSFELGSNGNSMLELFDLSS